jgi:hypothetical protein
MNVRQQPNKGWKITTLHLPHNHPPLTPVLMAFQNRSKQLSEDMKDFVRSLAGVHIPPEDILSSFRIKFPDGPLITAQDVKNMTPPSGGGSKDASNLLDRLLHLQEQDNIWLVK